ncbi:chain length determinant protein tyrosine kinase EpsG [Aeromonas media]|uniref:Chain length determinant protein tyrosine kinase EpsG n=1 Tax=Aeromonas media TaxID=651 RepID=A0A6M4YC91_AERME|nr:MULTISPECIES: hypothetical protein [Aeromonas]HDT6077802.1 hypothetical protein [Aeromonas veronii bv. veronii]MDE8809110.1 hypothetical protein [Aeromonas hydrophila]QJT21561.1 chain length determinant protein tyrosine kinase EpsG [Aeromonas media]QYK82136.1 chain length determinant protein tyrosine kinase EpsG [Aeromonas media]UWH28712.1 hypothetical protein KW556_02910 [Aeromonas veronii]
MMPLSSRERLLEPAGMPRVGELLLAAGKLTELQLGQILKHQHEHGTRFGEAAQQLGLLSEADVHAMVARQFSSFLAEPGSALSERLYMAYAERLLEKEKIKALRSQLQLAWLAQGQRSLLLGGVDDEATRATLAGNLAIAFSQLGLATLLVDANLRGSALPALLGSRRRVGLSDLLAGRGELERLVEPVAGLEDLDYLPAGTPAPNPQELLSRKRMQQLVPELAQRYEVVIYHTPDQHEWYDTQILASLVPGVLLLARRDGTPLPALADMVARLRLIRAELLGCVYLD